MSFYATFQTECNFWTCSVNFNETEESKNDMKNMFLAESLLNNTICIMDTWDFRWEAGSTRSSQTGGLDEEDQLPGHQGAQTSRHETFSSGVSGKTEFPKTQ